MEGGTGKGAIFLCQIFIRVNPVHLWFKSSSTTDAHGCTQMESGKPFSAQPSRDYCGSERRVGAAHAWQRRKTQNYGKINRMIRIKSGTGIGAGFSCHIFIRVNPVHPWFKSSSTTDTHRCTRMEPGKPLAAHSGHEHCGIESRVDTAHAWPRRKTENCGGRRARPCEFT